MFCYLKFVCTLIVLSLCCVPECFSSASDTSQPVIRGDFADPSVIRVGDKYYAAGTSSEWAPHFPIYVSNDLVNWKMSGHIFPKKMPWMMSSFWAPELYHYNGKVYAYYTVRDTSGISCIGVATANSPETGFTDHGVIIRTGKEAIDAFVFEDGGELYISWKAYGLDKRPIELLASRLSSDGLRLEGETVSIMKDIRRKGMEGQSMIKRDGYYYLFYSAGSCCGVPCDYNVRVSRSRSLNGPFEDYSENPVLSENKEWMCTGHGTPVLHPDGRWFYLYHGYEKAFNVYTGRQALLSEIVWNRETGWPAFRQAGSASSIISASADSNTANMINGSKINRSLMKKSPVVFNDDFEQPDLDLQWSWDFRNTAIQTTVEQGTLSLAGSVKAGNLSGTALCIRPTIADYEVTTEVININPSMKGLVMYGDYNNSAGFGVKGNQLIVWVVNNNKKEILKTVTLKSFKAVGLKLVVNSGKMLRFFFKTDKANWSEVDLAPRAIKGLDVEFTKQWDRSARPGLIHEGKATEPAKFSFCRISAN